MAYEGQLPKVTEVVRGELRSSTCATSNLGDLCLKQERVWGPEGGSLSFPQPKTTRSSSDHHRPATLHRCRLLSSSPRPSMGPKPWDSFLCERAESNICSDLPPPWRGGGWNEISGERRKKFRAQLVSLTQCRFA